MIIAFGSRCTRLLFRRRTVVFFSSYFYTLRLHTNRPYVSVHVLRIAYLMYARVTITVIFAATDSSRTNTFTIWKYLWSNYNTSVCLHARVNVCWLHEKSPRGKQPSSSHISPLHLPAIWGRTDASIHHIVDKSPKNTILRNRVINVTIKSYFMKIFRSLFSFSSYLRLITFTFKIQISIAFTIFTFITILNCVWHKKCKSDWKCYLWGLTQYD